MKRVASLGSKKSGFTLLELLIVLAILIVIIGILGTTVWNSYKRALIRAATVKVTNTLTTAVEEFRMEKGSYPTMVEGLYVLAGMDNPDAATAAQQMCAAVTTVCSRPANLSGTISPCPLRWRTLPLMWDSAAADCIACSWRS